jgi:hypothetical protein
MSCINTKNLAQAAPIDSLYYSKLRIALGRETIRDGEKCKTKLVLKFIPIPFHTFYDMCVPLLHLSLEREGKQFPP